MTKIFTVHQKHSYTNHLGLEDFVDQIWGTFSDEAEAHAFADYLADHIKQDWDLCVASSKEDNPDFVDNTFKRRVEVNTVIMHKTHQSCIKEHVQYGIDEQARWDAQTARLEEAIANNDRQGVIDNMFL